MKKDTIIGLDLDGTCINYNDNFNLPYSFNPEVLSVLKQRKAKNVFIITNQGSMCISDIDNKKPTPDIVSMRIEYAIDVLKRNKIEVSHVYVSAFYTNVVENKIKTFANRVNISVPFTVFTDRIYRKPSSEMLRISGITEYWGDSEEDGRAAYYAGIKFKEIKRFIYEYV